MYTKREYSEFSLSVKSKIPLLLPTPPQFTMSSDVETDGEEVEIVLIDETFDGDDRVKDLIMNTAREVGYDENGSPYVMGIALCPNAHIDPETGDLRGFTAVVREDAPVNLAMTKLIGSKLEAGTAIYEIQVAEGTDIETVKKNSTVYKASVLQRVRVRDDYDAFAEETPTKMWTPSMGTDRYNSIEVNLIVDQFENSERWKLTISASLDYSSSRILEHAIREGWTVSQLYESKYMNRLRRASMINRDMIALRVARTMNATIKITKIPSAVRNEFVETAVSVSDSPYNTIIVSKRRVDTDVGDSYQRYAIHNSTYATDHLQNQIVVRLRNKGGNLLITKTTSEQWTNGNANSFPIDTGMTGKTPEYKSNPLSWFPNSMLTVWESLLNMNLFAQPDAYRPYTSNFLNYLFGMGMKENWKREMMLTVIIKVVDMDTSRVTLERMEQAADDEGYVTIPISNKTLRVILKKYEHAERPPKLKDLFQQQYGNKYVRVNVNDMRTILSIEDGNG